MAIRTPKPVICIVGPSGAGKDTVVQRLVEQQPDRFRKFVSTTTRPPRAGEVDGVDYHFVSPQTFTAWKREGRFLLDTEFAGARYGTLRSELETDQTLLAIVVESTAAELQQLVGARIVAITVAEDLVRQRMLARGDDPAEVAKRLTADAPRRHAMEDSAQWLIQNIDLDDAVSRLDAICADIESKHDLRRDLPSPPSADAPGAIGSPGL